MAAVSSSTAVVLAGSRPGSDPLAAAFGTDLKALVPIGGKPMVRWPVEALLASARFSSVRVLAQEPERIAQALPADPRLAVEKSAATIAATLERLCFDPTVEWPLFVTTADHVLIDEAMIDEFCDLGEIADIAIGVVERDTLMKRLPNSQRTWIRFRSGAYSGANMFLLSGKKVLPALELWRSVEQDRKKGWALLLAFGPVNLLAAVLRLRTIHQVLGSIGRRIGAKVEAVDLSDPLAAVDVDKLSDHDLVEQLLKERA
jgi:GTP:adenosylcobinamide-phosphate guanylyltransferase